MSQTYDSTANDRFWPPASQEDVPLAIPPPDGRQSPAAADIARGAGRCLVAHGFAVLQELTLASGRRADLIGVSERSEVWIIEVKSSIEDFRADDKWPDYRAFCDRFLFAVSPEFPRDLIPESAGLIIADRFHGEVVRPPARHGLVGARRKAVITRFGRTAAMRVNGYRDPDLERSLGT